MKIAIATDAWSPQVNGVVTTLLHTREQLLQQGHDVLMITPEGRRSVRCPTYPEIRLTVFVGGQIRGELDAFAPDCVHIATEGPIGWAVRRYCLRRAIPFTSAYHTQLPEYVRARAPVPLSWSVAALRRFHNKAARIMVPTRSIRKLLEDRGFNQVVTWSRGVQTDRFRPEPRFEYDLPRPIWVNVGRVAVEKNIEAFLDLDLPGSKVVVGDGPDKARLQASYPDCHFLGYQFGDELSQRLAGADVFVFPSKTDTFGLVMLEAMACGLPVAAYPVTGPIDVIRHGITGALNHCLRQACTSALALDRHQCRNFAESRSWARATSEFVSHLEVPRDSQTP